MIVGPDPLAVDAGAAVLAEGGNAIDAAITCAFAQGVVNPANTGLGGYALFTYQPTGGARPAPVVLDAPATAGSRATPAMWLGRYRGADASGWGFLLDAPVNEFGYQSICTPGYVAGLGTSLDRWGTIDLDRAVAPAARLAEEGYVIDDRVAAGWTARFQLSSPATVADYVRANAEASRIYLDGNDAPRRAGQIARNPDYAVTLRRLAASGWRDAYQGLVAERVADDLARNDAFVTREDLAGYEVRTLEPTIGEYRGLRIQTSPPPHGGPTLLAILAILEGWDLPALGHNGPEYILRVSAAMAAAFADRVERIGDPLFVDDPGDWADTARAGAVRARIEAGAPIASAPMAEVAGTTQVTVVDGTGNAVSLTHSLGGSSGVVTPGLGFMFNNSMANFDPRPGRPNSIAPGKGRSTGMAPTILLRDRRPILVLGASGATKIVTALAQVIVNIVDFGMSPQAAVSAPRFDCQGGPIRCHVRIPAAVCEAVGRRHPIERLPAAYGGLGLAHAIAIGPDGALRGGVDPGSSGMAVTVPSLPAA